MWDNIEHMPPHLRPRSHLQAIQRSSDVKVIFFLFLKFHCVFRKFSLNGKLASFQKMTTVS